MVETDRSGSIAVYVPVRLGYGVSGPGIELGWFDDHALVLGYVSHAIGVAIDLTMSQACLRRACSPGVSFASLLR